MRKSLLLYSLLALVAIASVAQAAPIRYSFSNVTNSSATNVATGEAQLVMDVDAAGAGQVSFTFLNLGPLASSITDVYFDDGTLLGIASITNMTGVDFSQGASPPNLPGGATIGFATTAGFSADSNPPTQPNGVNPLEQLVIVFNLISGQDFDDTIAALLTEDLRVGIHVQGFGDGGSESFVNVPEPNSAVLGALAIGFVGSTLRRRRSD